MVYNENKLYTVKKGTTWGEFALAIGGGLSEGIDPPMVFWPGGGLAQICLDNSYDFGNDRECYYDGPYYLCDEGRGYAAPNDVIVSGQYCNGG